MVILYYNTANWSRYRNTNFHKKTPPETGLKTNSIKSFRRDCLNRTFTGTSTAICASGRINNVLSVAFGDCLDRTYSRAGTARGAFVRNYISHYLYLSLFKN